MKIEKTNCSYQVTECDLKFGEQITLDGELLIPVSVFDKIRAEVNDLRYENPINFVEPVARLWEPQWGKAITAVLGIIDKYKKEVEK